MADELILSVGGKRYAGWTGMRIRRSLDSLCGTFDLSVTRREATEAEDVDIPVLSPCSVAIGGETVISGVIDRRSISLDNRTHDISIAGRDRAADLVDCAAIAKPGSWRGAAFKTIVEALVAPFGLTVRIDDAVGAPIRRFAIQPGETVQAAIERLNRFRGLVAWSEADGTIRIGNPTVGRTVGQLVEGRDFKSASVSHDATERFSQYIVRGQASGDDDTNGKAASQISATATDPAVSRYRPLIIIAEDQADAASLKKRAEWEANVRAARSQTVTVELVGWRDPQGALWKPTARVRVTAPSLSIDSELIVVSAEFSKDGDGTLTVLDLQRPEAWQQLTVPETADASSIARKAA